MTSASLDPAQIVIVVPDGLAADQKGRALPEPSFVYRQVLDAVAYHYATAHLILAPANDFGSGITEQEAARHYLASKGLTAWAAPAQSDSYIDTRGNAAHLRRALEEKKMWPLPPITLVTAELHAPRAALCFHKEGFHVATLCAVPYKIPANELIVSRLAYYRYPLLHKFYEKLAFLRDYMRPGHLSSLFSDSQ